MAGKDWPMDTKSPVVIKHMPEKFNMREARSFWLEMEPILTSDRPQIVFDMSTVKSLDAAGVDMLLKCMAEAMKRDGDLKLAAVSPAAAVILEMTRTDRFFEIYDNRTDAIRSFTRFLPGGMRYQPYNTPSKESEPGEEAAA
jgi:anti-anti-sigma factor